MSIENAFKSIKPIDKVSINKICSGQVVLSLSTAVKELIENSLDAGSSYIHIALVEYGSREIKVSDNGSGVEESDFQGLVLKHHTSKISHFEDLNGVETFGFRGEALSSLCALGSMEVTTRHKSASLGTHLIFDHQGNIIESSVVARQEGTTVSIANLFVTLPVRHKEFLRNIKKEFGKLCSVIQAYALWNLHCSIFFSNCIGGKPRTVLDVKNGELKERISGIFGSKQTINLLEIKTIPPDENLRAEFGCAKVDDQQNVQLTGYISSCASYAGRSSADRQYIFINSRPVDYNKIVRIINDIYHQYNPHQNPFFVINIVASGLLDVNVVPDKRQIMLEHENLVLATIKSTLVGLYKDLVSTVPLSQTKLTFQGCLPQRKDKLSIQDLHRFKAIRQETTASTSNGLIKDSFLRQSKRGRQEERLVAKRPRLASPPRVKAETDAESKALASCGSIDTVVAHPSQKNYDVVQETDSESESESDSPSSPQTLGLPLADGIAVDLPNSSSCKAVTTVKKASQESCNNSSMGLDPGLSSADKKMRHVVIITVNLEKLQRLKKKEKIDESFEKINVKFSVKIEPSSNKRAEDELSKEITKESFHHMKVIGQFNRGFIIAKLDSDLFIIDQHATDEKARLEFLSNKKIEQQRLAVPQQLHLSADKEELFLERAEMVRWNGFDFAINKEAFVTERIALTAVPVLLGATFHHDDLDQLLFLLSHTPNGQRCRLTRVRDVLASKACRMSVMVGTVLNMSQMEQLISRMAELEQPWNCPHGRPTIRHLLSLQLILK